MSSDEDWVRRVAATLRSALEHERTAPRQGGDAIKAAVGAIFDDPRSKRGRGTKDRRTDAS
jgi:hypothetical protein